VRMSDGSIRNGFTIRVTNKAATSRDFHLAVEDIDGAQIDSPPLPHDENGRVIINVGTDQTAEVRVLVTVPKDLAQHLADHDDHAGQDKSIDIKFRLSDPDARSYVAASDHFFTP